MAKARKKSPKKARTKTTRKATAIRSTRKAASRRSSKYPVKKTVKKPMKAKAGTPPSGAATAKKRAAARKKTTSRAQKSSIKAKVNALHAKKQSIRKPSNQSRKAVTVIRHTVWFYISNAVFVLVIAAILGLLAANNNLLERLGASLFGEDYGTEYYPGSGSSDTGQPPVEPTPTVPGITGSSLTTASGILISQGPDDPNAAKLLDIFGTVFPGISVTSFEYQSNDGQKIVDQFSMNEVPNIYFEKNAFESEPLSGVVRDLFKLNRGYYELNVSLVNPSGQLLIDGPPTDKGGIVYGDNLAPITIYIYSDALCQHCRVNERNNLPEFKKLAEEGLVQIVFLDLPQNIESIFHSTALECQYRQGDIDDYLELREIIYDRANLTKAYTKRALERSGIDYEQDCDELAFRKVFKERARIASREGVSIVPTIYIGDSGSTEFVRFSSSQNFLDYQTVFDALLSVGNEG